MSSSSKTGLKSCSAACPRDRSELACLAGTGAEWTCCNTPDIERDAATCSPWLEIRDHRERHFAPQVHRILQHAPLRHPSCRRIPSSVHVRRGGYCAGV